jgi:helix-turn-helix protein
MGHPFVTGGPHMRSAQSAITHRERPIPRRGLSRVEAATYLGISPSKFDELRKDGRIGPAKCLDGRKLFAIEMLDEFFDALPDENHDAVEDWTAAV